MVVNTSNLFSESYSEVTSFLKDNISDPRGRFKKQWVHPSMPNVNASGFNGYPFIIFSVDIGEQKKSFDADTSEKVFRMLLSVYSDEATEIDSISDEIASNFKDETKLTSFKAREIASSPITWNLDVNGKKVLTRDIGFIFRSRL